MTIIEHMQIIKDLHALAEAIEKLTLIDDLDEIREAIKNLPPLLPLPPEEQKVITPLITALRQLVETSEETSKENRELRREVKTLKHRLGSGRNKNLSPTFNGDAIEALGKARGQGVKDKISKSLQVGGVNLFSSNCTLQIGVNAAKLYRYIVSEFTKNNTLNAKGDQLEQQIFIDLKDFAEANGVKTETVDGMKNFRRKVKQSLETLLSTTITWTEKIKGKQVSFSGMNYIGKFDIRGDAISVEFTRSMSEYLTSLPLIQYPRALYALDDRDSNAFAMGEALCVHYSQDNNVTKNTANKLSVKSLLECTALPTREKIKGQKLTWETRVKEPFERSLDKLYQCGVLASWRYCRSGGHEISDEEIYNGAIDSYETFLSLIVMYEINDFQSLPERKEAIAQKNAEKIAKARKTRSKKKGGEIKKTAQLTDTQS